MKAEDLAAIHSASMTDQRPWGAPTFEGFLGFPGAILVARESGFALGRVIADEAELLTLAVRPEARRRGIARDCLSGFEETARSKGALRAFLEVAAHNRAARALYDGAGFGIVGHRPAYYRAPDGRRSDAILMEKSLVPA